MILSRLTKSTDQPSRVRSQRERGSGTQVSYSPYSSIFTSVLVSTFKFVSICVSVSMSL